MVAPFPVVKLGVLVIKQISKPLANFVKRRAVNNKFFRDYICMPPAQIYHFFDDRVTYYVRNVDPTDKNPHKRLNEKAAIDLGANLLGEFVIISVASIILVWEYNRQKEKEAAKEAMELQVAREMEARVTDLAFANEELDTKVRELTRLVYGTPALMAETKQDSSS